MCKEGWCVRLGQEEGTVYWRVSGTVRNTLKWGGIKKRGRKKFFLKKRGQGGSGSGCLKKRGGAGTTEL